jgi:hypothetical protein
VNLLTRATRPATCLGDGALKDFHLVEDNRFRVPLDKVGIFEAHGICRRRSDGTFTHRITRVVNWSTDTELRDRSSVARLIDGLEPDLAAEVHKALARKTVGDYVRNILRRVQ